MLYTTQSYGNLCRVRLTTGTTALVYPKWNYTRSRIQKQVSTVSLKQA